MPKRFESKLFLATTGSQSLKTTVPQSVATVLGLEAGDSLVWDVDVSGQSAVVKRGSAAKGADVTPPAPPRAKR